ncbi:MAG: transposase [Elusimicrobiota bacterium]|nr:transposase [Elusimicrobiota bacterium]
MPRKSRHHRVDSVFHIVSRGVDRQPIFLTDRDRETFLTMLDPQLAHAGARMLAYCLMPNHFHLLIGTGATPLGRPLQAALTAYSVRFNKLYRRCGHLFEARFWSSECADPGRIEHVAAYIHLNPVRAHLTPTPGRWAWSSCAEWESGVHAKVDFERLSSLAGRSASVVRMSHQRIIDEAVSASPSAHSIEELIARCAAEFGVSAGAMCSGARGSAYTRAKISLVARALKSGHRLTKLARALNCTPEALYMLRARTT